MLNVRTNPCHKTQRIAEKIGLRYVKVHTGVWKEPGRLEMESFLNIVCNPENQPVYLFCKGGRDRTAFYIALYRVAVDGWTPEQACTELRAHRLRKYWPIFWRYDDVLRNNLAWIRDYGNEHRGKLTHYDFAGRCECKGIDFSDSKHSADKTQSSLTSMSKANSH